MVILRHHLSVFLLLLLPSWSFVADAQSLPLDITADSIEYLSGQNMMIARGNVEVRESGMVLKADYMSVQTVMQEIHARGNVFYQSGANIWRGEEFRYNIKTKTGDFGTFSAYYDPMYVTARESRRTGPETVEVTDVTLTTCEGDNPAVSIHAREASIENRRIYLRGAAVYIADLIPIFYLPYYTRSLDAHETFFQFLPGYNSRLGAFLLTAYNYPVAGPVRGRTHADVYSERGVGLGQDFLWRDKAAGYEGIVQGYYLHDSKPLEGSVTENRAGQVDEERYRLRLAHRHEISDRDRLRLEANYLSDPFVLKDFFRKEFREAVQPENRATLTHRGDDFVASAMVNKRLNDFYTNVDRVPELRLDLPRQKFYESDFYYESRNSMSLLEKVYPDGSGTNDLDAYRFDTDHLFSYPIRTMGFLNFIPRAGYRGTFYSRTVDQYTITNIFVVTPSNAPPFTTNVVKDVVNYESGELRNLPQLGWEASFKAFRTWNNLVVLSEGDGLRHVAEPYLDHTFIPDPNVEPADLPQFDEVDTLDERHDVKLGMRNKLQTRWDRTAYDIVDLDVYTFLRIEKPEGESDFSPVFWDGDYNLHPDLLLENDGSYDASESELQTINTRIRLSLDDSTRFGLEHRYRLDEQSLIGANMDYQPSGRWGFEAGVRHDIEESELEEQYYLVKRTGNCVSWGLGFRQIFDEDDDELEVWLQLWLTALPDAIIDFDY